MQLDLLIPTYNRASMLRKTLASIQRASIPDGLSVRVVVLNNNCTDDTEAVCREFPCESLLAPKQGRSAALNVGVRASSADLIGMIDDDEELSPDWFAVVFREFQDSELHYLGGQYLPNFECEPPSWVRPGFYHGIAGIILRNQVERFSPHFHGILVGGNAVIRRDTLHKVMPYPENIGRKGKGVVLSGEDEIIYHRLLDLGLKGISHPDLKIYHWIPRSRMTKKYYRRWTFGLGVSKALSYGRPNAPFLLGIPRYHWRNILMGLLRPFDFSDQLRASEALGYLYAAYFLHPEEEWDIDADRHYRRTY